MTTIEEVPSYYYPDELRRFRLDTAEHEMTVLHNDGLYRRVQFMQPGTRMYWYDLITWPGNLVIKGDMGTYAFCRVEDMFEFFDGGYINPGYWSEKLTAHSGYREYSENKARRSIRDHFEDRKARLADPGEVWQRVVRVLMDPNVIALEHELRDELMRFRYGGLDFHETWEWDLRDFTYQFLWCCHAIQQGIKRFRGEHIS